MTLLLIDNYDSFTHNLSHLFASLVDVNVDVVRNDEDILYLSEQYDGIIIGPGPGSPSDMAYFGLCADLLRMTQKPVLGVCLGFQGIALEIGAHLKKATLPMHGKVSPLTINDGSCLLKDVTQRSEVMRYHSLMIDTDKPLPTDMVVTAEVAQGTQSDANGREIMAIRHATRPLYGVQFHPESFATSSGIIMARNFSALVRKELA